MARRPARRTRRPAQALSAARAPRSPRPPARPARSPGRRRTRARRSASAAACPLKQRLDEAVGALPPPAQLRLGQHRVLDRRRRRRRRRGMPRERPRHAALDRGFHNFLDARHNPHVSDGARRAGRARRVSDRGSPVGHAEDAARLHDGRQPHGASLPQGARGALLCGRLAAPGAGHMRRPPLKHVAPPADHVGALIGRDHLIRGMAQQRLGDLRRHAMIRAP